MKVNSAESMINGRVGLMTNRADVEIAGEHCYQLEFCHGSYGRLLSYRLLNTRDQLIDEWIFEGKWCVKRLNLNGQHRKVAEKLEYKIGAFGGRCFITAEGKKPLYMDLTENSRAYELDGMFFKHIDFQSHIHFRCDKKQLNQAILVASILFNPPLSSEASG